MNLLFFLTPKSEVLYVTHRIMAVHIEHLTLGCEEKKKIHFIPSCYKYKLIRSISTQVSRAVALHCLLSQAEPSLMALLLISRTRTIVLYCLLSQAVRSISTQVPRAVALHCLLSQAEPSLMAQEKQMPPSVSLVFLLGSLYHI